MKKAKIEEEQQKKKQILALICNNIADIQRKKQK